MNEALTRSETRVAKSLIRQANVIYRNIDKVEKFAFKNTRNLAKVERSLGGMIADLKREYYDGSYYNRQVEKIVGDDVFFNFKEFADEAYEKMVSAESAFEEHVRQLKDNDPDAQETLDIFLNELESANRSYSEFLRSAIGAMEDAIEGINESTKAYGDALKAIAKDRQLKNLTKKDRDTLVKISKLLDKEKNEELNQDDEDKVKEVIAMLKKASKAHAGQADDLQKAVNEKRFDMIYRLDDMDNNYAGVVTAMAKKAGLFLRTRKDIYDRGKIAVELKGDVKKIDKFIRSLPEAHYKGKKLIKGQKTLQEKEIKGLRNKAEKSGMPYSVLKQVYNRGMAAWKTGHRPGTTPQQWAMARVNSFTTKSSGTWGGADKDLAAKVRGSKKK